jgi:hypothetical protein
LKKRLLKKQIRRLKIHLFLKQSLIEGITVVLFIGAILLSLLIRVNLAVLKTGELKNQSGAIIDCIVIITI